MQFNDRLLYLYNINSSVQRLNNEYAVENNNKTRDSSEMYSIPMREPKERNEMTRSNYHWPYGWYCLCFWNLILRVGATFSLRFYSFLTSSNTDCVNMTREWWWWWWWWYFVILNRCLFLFIDNASPIQQYDGGELFSEERERERAKKHKFDNLVKLYTHTQKTAIHIHA